MNTKLSSHHPLSSENYQIKSSDYVNVRRRRYRRRRRRRRWDAAAAAEATGDGGQEESRYEESRDHHSHGLLRTNYEYQVGKLNSCRWGWRGDRTEAHPV